MPDSKHIVVAANPFGFGPVGNAIPILGELVLRFSHRTDVCVHFVGSEKCQGIIPDFGRVKRTYLDERDENKLVKFLQGLSGTIIVIGVQNRFIINAGIFDGCKTMFVDVLAWMWRNIPDSHLVADDIFWMQFPGISEKLEFYPDVSERIHIVSGIYDTGNRKSRTVSEDILFCLGGGFNPLRDGTQSNYLSLAFAVLGMSKLSEANVSITSGNDAADFLRKLPNRPVAWNISTFSHDEMIDKLSVARYLLSVGGQSSTMEAILSNVPVIFFIPSNLSQALLQKKFASEIGMDDILWWKKFLTPLLVNIEYSSEKDFMECLEKISGEILSNPEILINLTSSFDMMLNRLLVDENYLADLQSIGKQIGSSGASQMTDVIETFLYPVVSFGVGYDE